MHKWEKELSSPDTQNLIALADVLGTSVDYIINGSMQSLCTPQKKRNKIFTYIIIVIITAVITFAATVIFIANAPVSFDAGACGGGFATAVFDQYADALIRDNYFYLTKDFKSKGIEVVGITPDRSSREATYEGKAIYMSFDIKYSFSNLDSLTKRIRFMGDRKWIQYYQWQMITESDYI